MNDSLYLLDIRFVLQELVPGDKGRILFAEMRALRIFPYKWRFCTQPHSLKGKVEGFSKRWKRQRINARVIIIIWQWHWNIFDYLQLDSTNQSQQIHDFIEGSIVLLKWQIWNLNVSIWREISLHVLGIWILPNLFPEAYELRMRD